MEPKVSDEYSAQLLEIPPSVITEIVIGTIDTAVADLIDGMYDSLKSLDDIPEEDSEKGTEAIRNKFIGKMSSISAKLENFFLEYVFKVPDHVLLPEDEAQRQKCSSKDEKKIVKEIEALKVSYQNALYMKEILSDKIKEGKETLLKFKTARSEMEATSKILVDNRMADLTEKSEFIRKKYQDHVVQLGKLNCFALSPGGLDDNANQTSKKKLENMLE